MSIAYAWRPAASVPALLALSLLSAGCQPEKEAVPDPERPPTPKVVSTRAMHTVSVIDTATLAVGQLPGRALIPKSG